MRFSAFNQRTTPEISGHVVQISPDLTIDQKTGTATGQISRAFRADCPFYVTHTSSIRGLARSVERDIKRVHDDVSALSEWGIVERAEDGKVDSF